MRPEGSLTAFSVTPFITRVVPMVTFHCPGCMAPEATCDAQPSVTPAVILFQ